jgi:hypothetical protein
MHVRDNLKEVRNLLDNLDKGADRTLKRKGKDSLNINPNAFADLMGTFYKTSDKIYQKLDAECKSVEEQYESVVSLYGEDPKTMFPDEFFGIFWKFRQSYIQAKADNEIAILKEKASEKREAEQRVSWVLPLLQGRMKQIRIST